MTHLTVYLRKEILGYLAEKHKDIFKWRLVFGFMCDTVLVLLEDVSHKVPHF